MDFILSNDIIFYLVQFLCISSIATLSTVSGHFYQSITPTRVYKEIKRVSKVIDVKNTLESLCQWGCKRILHTLIVHGYCMDKIARSIFKVGNREMMQWLNDQTNLSLGAYVKESAIYGNICALQWCYENNYDLLATTKFKTNFPRRLPIYLMDMVAERGHVKVLQWYFSCVPRFIYSCLALDRAAQHGHLAVFDWFVVNKLKLKYSPWVFIHACQNNRLAVLDWLHEHHIISTLIDEDLIDRDRIAKIMIHSNNSLLHWFKLHSYDYFATILEHISVLRSTRFASN